MNCFKRRTALEPLELRSLFAGDPVAVGDSYTTNEDTPIAILDDTTPAIPLVQWSSNGHYYGVVVGNTTWLAAKADAEARRYGSQSGHLVTITSQDEYNFITSQILNTYGDKVFIGLQDPAGTFDWQWVTGEAFSYSRWNAGEPNNVGSERYVEMWNNAGWVWNNIPGTVHTTGAYLIEFDGPAQRNLLANDTDVPSGAIVELVDDVDHGLLTLTADGKFQYTPDVNYSGTDSFSYCIVNGTAPSNIATASITVLPVNDAPSVQNDSYTVNEDATLVVIAANGVARNDLDIDSASFTVAVVEGPKRGSLTLNSDGSFTYTPAANFFGVDQFTYQASDGTATSALATVSVNVLPRKDVPVAVPDAYTMTEDTTLSITTAPVNSTITVAHPFRHVVFNSATGKLYGSLGSDGGSLANKIAIINPQTGTIEGSFSVGADPSQLALSSNGRYLYAGISGGSAVIRYDLVAGTLGALVTFPGGQYPDLLNQMRPIAGSPDAVLISRRYPNLSPPAAGTSVFEWRVVGGVETVVELPEYVGRGAGTGGPDIITLDSTGTRGIGYENSHSGYSFYGLGVNDDGVHLIPTANPGISGNVDRIEKVGDRLFTSFGQVWDLSDGAQVGSFLGGSSFVIDETLNRLFSVTTAGTTHTLRAYDLTTLTG